MKYFLQILLILFAYNLQAQNSVKDAVLRHLEEQKSEWQLTSADLQNPVITDEYTSRHNGVTHIYMRQTHAGIEVHNAIINANVLSDGRILGIGNRFVSNLSERINTTTPNIGVLEAVQAGARDLGLTPVEPFFIQNNISPNEYEINDGGIAAAPIQVKLMYLDVPENGVRLIWQLGIYTKNHQNNWKMSVDAITGQILEKRNAVLRCDFGAPHPVNEGCRGNYVHSPTSSKGGDEGAEISKGGDEDLKPFKKKNEGMGSFSHSEKSPILQGARSKKNLKPNLVSNTYNVYPMPIESPIHGNRALLVNPADATASPFGWHDNNGVAGPEFLDTRGNNVRATEDRDNDGGLGYVPDGGDSLIFDFPLDFSQDPVDNLDAAITNLFYWNNIMHDVWYQYGFDEISGNFQDNNYGNGGTPGDYIIAELQDGAGTNNAFFGAPEDGSNGRMQMFLWTSSAGNIMVNEPQSIVGNYQNSGAAFGPSFFNLTGMAVEAFDASADLSLVCESVVNVDEIDGNIALIERGECNFTVKVRHAQDAGAIAAIICNNEPQGVIPMGGTDASVTIPALMMSNQDCATIRAAISEGVELTMSRMGDSEIDGGFDGGIIAHEYGHGVSIRLTGGRNDSGCLSNDHQMGEGWSDWMTLVMTPVSDSDGTIPRGIGTYAISSTTDDVGIRTYHYSTDMNVNPHTYSDIPSESIPHGVGSIWCAMIWDLYWSMVEVHGFDDDIYNGTGGNNMTMQLVTDAMKLQPCNPNFVDGRNAILLADEILYEGANQCLIWEAFARRGLGYGATGAPVDVFDTYPFCSDPPQALAADFDVNIQQSCDGMICFKDISESLPDSWNWDFGDGNTSTEQNPTHQYTQDGVYAVTLEVTNQFGTDTETKTAYINVGIQLPIVETSTCENGMATLTASTSNGTLEWLDENGEIVGEGNTFTVPPIAEPTTFSVQSVIKEAQKVGPTDSYYGGGNFHNTGFRGKVFFEAYQSFQLSSVWINSGSSGNKTFDLETSDGQVINSVTVFASEGPQRVDIGWDIEPGSYAMAAETVNLFRNSAGTSYPYDHCSGALSITGAPPEASPDYYYYFYDWEIETGCTSAPVSVDVDCIAVGIEDNTWVETFNLFPNPNDGTFAIELVGEAEKNIELTIFDVLGKAIYTDIYDFYSGELNTQIDLQNIAPGTYMIKLSVRDRVNYQKIVVY